MSYTGNSAITSFQIESKSFIHSSLSSSASSGTSHSSPLFPSSIDTISSSSSSWSDGSLTSDSFLSSSSTWVVQTVTGNSNSITLRKLKPLTRIQVRIRAENMFGWSEYSDILNFVTEEEGTENDFSHLFLTHSFETFSLLLISPPLTLSRLSHSLPFFVRNCNTICLY